VLFRSGVDRNGNTYAGMFYGSTYQQGGLQSTGNILDTGYLTWNGAQTNFSAGAVATNPQGQGGVFQYWSPSAGGNLTDFFAYAADGNTGLQVIGARYADLPALRVAHWLEARLRALHTS
jgi:hypothetical protein